MRRRSAFGHGAFGDGAFGPGLLGGLASASGISLTALSGWLVVSASHRPQILTLMAAIVGVRAFGMARPALRYAERLLSHDRALGQLADDRVTVYERLIPLTPARLGRRSRSQVLTGAVDDLEDQVYAQVRVVVPVVGAAVAGLLSVLAVALWSYVAALIVLAGLLGCAAGAAMTGWGERRSQQTLLAAREDVSRLATLIVTQAREIAAVGATGQLLDQLDTAQAIAAHAERRRSLWRAGGLILTGLVCAATTVVMALHVADLVRGGLSDAVGALLVLTPVAVADALALLPDAAGSWARAARARERLGALLDQPPALGPHGDLALDSGPAAVEGRQLCAEWVAGRPALGPVDLTVTPGDRMLVTGPNGCGKSTLLAVLATHLDPSSGGLLLGGTPVDHVAVADLRARVAVLDDEPHVFASTVRENLRLARPGADDDALRAALRDADLDGWLTALPDGLDTHLGAGARGVSGGERTRLGLARAHLSERPVYLLDEPVAHLDHATATAVLEAVVRRSREHGTTVVLVSHDEEPVHGFTTRVELVAPVELTARDQVTPVRPGW